VQADWPGLKRVNMIKTASGATASCEWTDIEALANARPHMIATLIRSAARWRIWAATRRHRSGVRPVVLELK